MSAETISRRYAIALTDVVLKSGETETVRAELKMWEELMAANVNLQTALGNPAIARTKKEKVLEGLIEKVAPSRTTANFIRVLLSNGRLTELSGVIARFELALEERSGVVSAEVTSARELADAQRKELKASLEKRTGKQVKFNFALDPDLIGGVVTRVGSTVYDSSVKTQLENLKEELVNG